MGYEEPLVFRGMKTGDTVTRHSDILLMFLLKKLDPSYSDNNKVELQVSDKLGELMEAITGKGSDSEPGDLPEKG
jgi:hypothetical protein